MARKSLFMETTEVAPEKTIFEIQQLLSEFGANAVMTEYEKNQPVALAFRMKVKGDNVPFLVPCRWRELAELFRRKAGISDSSWNAQWESDKRRRAALEAKARQVAWRQVLRWIEVQLAFTQTGQVTVDEVFFQYMQIGKGTLYQAAMARGLTALLENKGPTP